MTRLWLAAAIAAPVMAATANSPAIGLIRPTSITAGAPEFTLTVTGANFVENCSVLWNDTYLATTRVSAAQLTAKVPASLIALTGAASITVMNPDGARSTGAEITIAPAMTILTLPTLPAAVRLRVYSNALALTGGVPPYRFTLQRGNLPVGISLNESMGTIAGMPIAEGSYEFTILVGDAAGSSTSRAFSLNVFRELDIVTTALPHAIAGIHYSFPLAAAGGSMPYQSWHVTAGTLPPGVALSPTSGVLIGAAQDPGAYQFTVRLRDSAALTATRILTLQVTPPLAMEPPAPLPALVAGSRFTHRLIATGGSAPLVYSIASGRLPPGLTLRQSEGIVEGAPESAGSWRVTMQVTDAIGQQASVPLDFTVIESLAITSAETLPNATVGVPYSNGIDAAGGTAPLRFAVVTGALPSGLQLDAAAGMVAGTPASPGVFQFTVAVADALGRTVSRAFSLSVAAPPLPILSFGALPAALAAAQQTRVTLALSEPYPLDLGGTVTLDAPRLPDDLGVRFSNGRRTASFRIPAGATSAQFDGGILGLQSGTTAGEMVLQAALDAPAAPPSVLHTMTVQTSPPVLREATWTLVPGGFQLAVTGFSPSRELTQAVFRFTAAPGGALDTAELLVPLRDMAGHWFDKPECAAFGSQFTYRQPFTFPGNAPSLASVTVILENSVGASEPLTVTP